MANNTRSFANTYRPIRFAEVVGQKRIIDILKKSILKKRIYGSYIFEGPFGTGKTTLARIFAQRLLCTNPVGSDPCFQCESCISFTKGNNPNYLEIDAATYSGVNDMRKLQEFARMEAFGDCDYRILILDEAHNLSDAAFNTLLKTLEEAREGLVFLFCTTAGAEIIDTVRSRSVVCELEPPSIQEIQERLELIAKSENIIVEPQALRLIITQTELHLRDAIKELEIISSYATSVTRDEVIKYYGLQEYLEILKFLSNLKTRLGESIHVAYTLATKYSTDYFFRTMQAIIADIYRLMMRQEKELRVLDSVKDGPLAREIVRSLGKNFFLVSKYVNDVRKRGSDLDTLHADVIYMSLLTSHNVRFEKLFDEKAERDLQPIRVNMEQDIEHVQRLMTDIDYMYMNGIKQPTSLKKKDNAEDNKKQQVLSEKDFIESLWNESNPENPIKIEQAVTKPAPVGGDSVPASQPTSNGDVGSFGRELPDSTSGGVPESRSSEVTTIEDDGEDDRINASGTE